ncbi:MAG TPA: 2-polyprenyl-3-methyl-6-methoxy-1,4-benzoquinone monooxygenase [Xanthomonadales bacterium]|nr:2-polyprenyl-3-methyl-6-methoxy-1,4-benzoquinone monooxygenase [Xanthomonadales bacterium]
MKQTSLRKFSPVDRLITSIDEALRISTGAAPDPQRNNPAGDSSTAELSEDERRHVAGLMRVNHAGEICAQALYAGQAVTARDPQTAKKMQEAADEEIDHLAWCEERLTELDEHPSVLNPFWYLGSFAIGAMAGIAGDRWSLGFVKETERQVEAHLEDHLGQLPETDARSHAILDQMKTDEARHAEMADQAGGADLPQPIRSAMTAASMVMKSLAYRF